MAVTFIFTPSTVIASAEVNSNFSYITDFIDVSGSDVSLADGNTFQIADSSGNDTLIISHDGSNILYTGNATAGAHVFRDAGGNQFEIDNSASNRSLLDFHVRSGNSLMVYDSGNTDDVTIAHNGNRGSFTSNTHILIGPDNNGDELTFIRHPRDDNGSATYVNSNIQSGWGYIQGDNTAQINTTVTFPVAYNNDNIRVVITVTGYKNGVPTDEGDFGLSDPSEFAQVRSVTSTTFSARLYSTAFGSANYYGFSWIAIGPSVQG